MGNYMACASIPSAQIATPNSLPSQTVTVMHANGVVEEFQRPMVVAELMLENPQHFVWDSSSVNTRKRVPALPADARLELGHLYYLLPSLAAAKLPPRADPPHRTKKSVQNLFYGATLDLQNVSKSEKTVQAFEMKQNGSVTQVTVSAEYLKELMGCDAAAAAAEGGESGCDNSELEMAYRRHVMAKSCSWKPKLETVEEMGL